jgi:hypothetical protein
VTDAVSTEGGTHDETEARKVGNLKVTTNKKL